MQKSAAKDSNQIPPKVLGPKQPKKISSKKTKGQITLEAKHEKKNLVIDIGKINFDLAGVPSPLCSCTGPGVRMAGRKMSIGAINVKLLLKLSAEGYNLSSSSLTDEEPLARHW
ncbi:hypothetical protein D5086_001209 [Populus alba]|uniref:Uncharacterized protein n=1 Tax=Populus alba TaxID=43335 RepID=A0ACC4CYR0_POPAL